jgi:uncharacterized protein
LKVLIQITQQVVSEGKSAMHKPRARPYGSIDGGGIIPSVPKNRSALAFFTLTFGLSVPFWIAGAVTRVQLLPAIPVSALGLVCMVGAASMLVYRENGWGSVVALLKRAFDFKRVKAKRWYLPTLLLMPGVMAASYVVMRLTGVALPAPQVSLTTTLMLVRVFFVAAVGEELGWSGYAIDPLQGRVGALGGALLLGVMWAMWHLIPLLSAGRSPAWIAWWSLGTVAYRIIITWLYTNTGRSVFVAALFHATINVTYFLFPVQGSYYDPRVTSLIVALIAAIITVAFGPRTLIRAHTAQGPAAREALPPAR